MRIARVIAVATLMVAVCVASAAQAQQQRGQGRGGPGGFGGFGGGPGGGLLALAQIPAVQTEIEAVPEQVTEITELARAQRTEGGQRGQRGQGRGNQNLSDAERASLAAERQKAVAATDAKLGEILLDHQMTRLREISIQQAGVNALTREDVASELKLSDAKKAKIAETISSNNEKLRTEMQALFSGDNREGAREKIQQLRDESDATVIALLSAEEKASFEKLKGEKFEMPQPTFGGRGGRGGAEGAGGRPGARGGEGGRQGRPGARGAGRPGRPAGDN